MAYAHGSYRKIVQLAPLVRSGIFRVVEYEARCGPCEWYGSVGLKQSEAQTELTTHRATDLHKERAAQARTATRARMAPRGT